MRKLGTFTKILVNDCVPILVVFGIRIIKTSEKIVGKWYDDGNSKYFQLPT